MQSLPQLVEEKICENGHNVSTRIISILTGQARTVMRDPARTQYACVPLPTTIKTY